MRVGILGLFHEAHTFNPRPADMAAFRRGGLSVGEQVRRDYARASHEVGGFLQGLEETGIEAVPLFFGRCAPTGIVPAATLDELLKMMFDQLTAAGKLDGVLAAAHGAAVSENHPDMDGYWLSLLRVRVGPDVPIVCTVDPRANLTQRMIDAANATLASRTPPPVGQRRCGLEAAGLLARVLRKEVRPTQAAAMPAVVINAEKPQTLAPLLELADGMLKRPGVLSVSVLPGFPYADVAEMGSSFIAVTDNDAALARQLADELARCLWEHRHELAGRPNAPDASGADPAKLAYRRRRKPLYPFEDVPAPR